MTPRLKDIIDGKKLAQSKPIEVGFVFSGPKDGVDHDKYYIIIGKSDEKVCAVLINSEINQFIQKKPHLLKRQLKIAQKDHSFLRYDSYINCAHPLKGNADSFRGDSFTYLGELDPALLKDAIEHAKSSGDLSIVDMDAFWSK